MAARTLWLPDGTQIGVEWYVSHGKAAGVESIRDDWVPHTVGPARTTGFSDRVDPYGPERDDSVAQA